MPDSHCNVIFLFRTQTPVNMSSCDKFPRDKLIQIHSFINDLKGGCTAETIEPYILAGSRALMLTDRSGLSHWLPRLKFKIYLSRNNHWYWFAEIFQRVQLVESSDFTARCVQATFRHHTCRKENNNGNNARARTETQSLEPKCVILVSHSAGSKQIYKVQNLPDETTPRLLPEDPTP